LFWLDEREVLAGLSRYRLEELLGFPALLYRANRTLKSRGLDRGAVLEELVDRMTAPAGEARQ
jgi:hypothetical protein